MEDDGSLDWKRSALRCVALLVLLLSPAGAPAVGCLILYACDIPWDGPSQCALPSSLLDYFGAFVFLPTIWLGPFLGILWLMLSISILLACLWHAGRALWQAVMEGS